MRTFLKARGFEVHHGKRHDKLTHPDRPGTCIALPQSPSDSRWALNKVTEIRHQFGLDIRTMEAA